MGKVKLRGRIDFRWGRCWHCVSRCCCCVFGVGESRVVVEGGEERVIVGVNFHVSVEGRFRTRCIGRALERSNEVGRARRGARDRGRGRDHTGRGSADTIGLKR